MKNKKQPETISRKELSRRTKRLAEMQERNFQKHFAEHLEQLLPGAEVKRKVPLAEVILLAQIIGPDLSD